MEVHDDMEYKVLYLLMAGLRNRKYIAEKLGIDPEYLDECINHLIKVGFYEPETVH